MSKLSRYFADLSPSYNAELDDLRTDSEGNNVLKARLAQKRAQISPLLMMMQFAPEMVAVAFHGGFRFKDSKSLDSLVTRQPNKFPAWTALQKAIIIEPWAQTLIDTVLTDPNGESFLVTTVGLEYLNQRNHLRAAPVAEEHEDEHESDQRERESDPHSDDGENAEYDLDQAGADWLTEQGFDRKE